MLRWITALLRLRSDVDDAGAWPIGPLTPEHRSIQEAWGLTDAEWDAICVPSADTLP